MGQVQNIAVFLVKGNVETKYSTTPFGDNPPHVPSPTSEEITGSMVVETTSGALLAFQFGSFSLSGHAIPTPSPSTEGDHGSEYRAYCLTADGPSNGTFVGCTGASFWGKDDEVHDGPGGGRTFKVHNGRASLLVKLTVELA